MLDPLLVYNQVNGWLESDLSGARCHGCGHRQAASHCSAGHESAFAPFLRLVFPEMAQRLNVNAFEFVPRFGGAPAAPVERPAEDAPPPAPAPTISLNIGGAKPPTPAPAAVPAAVQAKIAPSPAAKSSRPASPDPPPSAPAVTKPVAKPAAAFNFTMDKAATDAAAIAREALEAADQATLDELYGKEEIDESGARNEIGLKIALILTLFRS